MNNPIDKKDRLYKVNDCDYIDVNDIDGIHIDKENKSMTVIYYGLPIPVTSSTWQRHICQRYLSKSDFFDVGKILDF